MTPSAGQPPACAPAVTVLPVPTPPAPPPLPPGLSGYLGYLIRVAYLHGLAWGRAALPAERSIREFGVLTVLDATGPRSQQDLVDQLDVNRTVMVAVVDRLEADGLLERRRNPQDRRAYALHLTEPGRAALVSMAAIVAGAERGFVAALPPADRARLVALLRPVASRGGERELPEPVARHTGYLLARSYYQGRERFEAALEQLGIRPRHFGLLSVVAEEEPIPQHRIADRLHVSGTAITQMLDDLESRGFLARGRDPGDRRAHAVVLQAEGRAVLEQARAAYRGVEDDVYGALTPAEREELRGLLRRLLSPPD
jgi:DNA-binding MarR family transcriptional regulator